MTYSFARLPRSAQVAVACVVAYALAYVLPGTGPMLGRNAPVAIVTVGVIYGTVTGLGALALILTYRSSRFINFAYGAMGSLVGVLAIGLYKEHGVPFAAVLPLGVVGGALTGIAVELLALRRFRDASRLVLTVASIGLAQLLGGFELLGSKAMGFVSLSGGFKVPMGLDWDLGAKTLSGDELLIVLVAPAVLTALGWFLLRTDQGIAARAAAENVERALVLGIPVRRNTTIVWGIVGALAALTFILKAPFAGITPGVATAGPAVLLPALAAAVVARMESLPTALLAGVGLGIMEQVVRWNSPSTPSLNDVLFVGVIVVALFAQRASLSRAAAAASSSWSAIGLVRPIPDAVRRLPEVRAAKAAVLALVLVAAVVVPASWGADDQLLAAFALVWAIVGVSLVVLTGWGGNISLGQFAIVGVGAMVAGNLFADHDIDALFVVLLAGAAGGVVALVLGLPALRIGSLFLAVTTLAFAVALDTHFLNVNNFPELVPSNVARPHLFERYDLEDQYAMYLVCLAVLAIVVVVVTGLRRSRTGRVLIATRDNRRAAAAAGVRVRRATLGGFVLAGSIAGVAGALHVLLLHGPRPGSYPTTDSITVFSTSVIGGLGSVSGAISGVLLFQWLETLTFLGDLRLVVSGAGLLFVLYAVPGGIGQWLFAVRDAFVRRVAGRRGIELERAAAAAGSTEAVSVSTQLATTEVRRGKRQRRGAVGGDGERSERSEPTIGNALACVGIEAGYGPVQVLFGVDFVVAPGEIVALLGTNGAGKSTLLKVASGLLVPTAGTVSLDGAGIVGPGTDGLPADAVARRGLSLMAGGRGVFPTLSVEENLRLAAWMHRDDPDRIAATRADVLELFPVLAERAGQAAGSLSGGEQQMLALAGSLMTRPAVLLIDELSLGLAPTVVGQLFEVVREVHRRGTTIVVVEQSVNVSLELAQRAVFMEKGEVRFEGPAAELLDRPDLLRSVFIGSTGNGRAAAKKPATRTAKRTGPAPKVVAPPVLRTAGLTKRFGGITAVDRVDLTLADGEILGLIGHNGAGKTTLLDCISGFLDVDGGHIEVQGTDVTTLLPEERAAAGLGRSFQEAMLYPTLTVAEAVAVSRERHLRSRGVLADGLALPAAYERELEIGQRVDEVLELLGLGQFRESLTGELSTGTRRVVELGCLLAQDPDVLLLDEPSSGVAQRETEALGDLLRRVREQVGCSMLVIEHDMPLLSSLCDRMVALELGAVIAEGPPAAVLAHQRVIESYLGSDPAAIGRSGRRRRSKPARKPAEVF